MHLTSVRKSFFFNFPVLIKSEIFENWDIAKDRKFYKLNSFILVLRTRLGEVLINLANHERRLNEGPLMRPQKTEALLTQQV